MLPSFALLEIGSSSISIRNGDFSYLEADEGDTQSHEHTIGRKDIVKASNRQHLFPINYRYDYLDGLGSIFGQLAPPTQPKLSYGPATIFTLGLSDNSIELFPSSAGFPHRTSFGNPKQNKHWKHSLAVGLDSIRLFAEDDTFPKTLKNGMTLGQVASRIYSKAADDFLRHFVYMLPHADEERASLIEVVCAWVVVFDGKKHSRSFNIFGTYETQISRSRVKIMRFVGHFLEGNLTVQS